MIVLKILIIWFLLSIPAGLLAAGFLNINSGRCFFHGANRRKIIETGGYEYFECPVCGTREAEKIYGTKETGPINVTWLNGRPWLG